jgi:hypothetical protein
VKVCSEQFLRARSKELAPQSLAAECVITAVSHKSFLSLKHF